MNFSPEFAAGEPNTSLLRRISEMSGGRLLNPSKPGTDNTFTHDRIKTKRPLDLWEWLLKLAVILFVLDVGVRRIDLDREEWAKVTATVRKYVFFWKGAPRPVEAEESLATLLARRDQIRGGKTAAGTAEARAELFKPEQQPAANAIFGMSDPGTVKTELPVASPEPATTAAEEKPTATTSRLLEAKRRAQKRRDDK